MTTKAVIFDVDGVLVRTDAMHERAWRALAEREGLPFPDGLPDKLRGVSRERSLELLLGSANDRYTNEQRVELMHYKNELFLAEVRAMPPADVLPGVRELIAELKNAGIKLAAASASRTARLVLASTIWASAPPSTSTPSSTETTRRWPSPTPSASCSPPKPSALRPQTVWSSKTPPPASMRRSTRGWSLWAWAHASPIRALPSARHRWWRSPLRRWAGRAGSEAAPSRSCRPGC